MYNIGVTTFWIYLTGVLAAAQLGKMPALMPAVALDLDTGLVIGAVIISLIELGGALFGSVAALVSDRLSHRRTLLLALAALTAGSTGEAAASEAVALIFWRSIESLGYLGVIVSAPVLLARAANGAKAGLALALWSTFLPIGLAIGATSSGYLADMLSWRCALAVWAAIGLAMLLVGIRAPLPSGRDKMSAGSLRIPSRLAIVTAIAFGCFTCFQVAMLTLAPEFFVSEKGASLQVAGALTGIGALCTITGIAVPFWLSRMRAQSSSKRLTRLFAASLLVPAALLFAVYFEGFPFALSSAIFIVLNIVSGIFPALVFSLLPRLSHDSDVTAANGAIAQAGATGSLLGPPIYAYCVGLGGWPTAAAFGLVASSIAFLLILYVERLLTVGHINEVSG